MAAPFFGGRVTEGGGLDGRHCVCCRRALKVYLAASSALPRFSSSRLACSPRVLVDSARRSSVSAARLTRDAVQWSHDRCGGLGCP